MDVVSGVIVVTIGFVGLALAWFSPGTIQRYGMPLFGWDPAKMSRERLRILWSITALGVIAVGVSLIT